MQKYPHFLIVITLFFALSGICFGEVPNLINYEGTLSDSVGTAVPDGSYDVTFNIYETISGGSPIWSETWDTGNSQIMTYKGHFNVILGSHSPFPDNFFMDYPVTYFAVTVGQDSEMLPRQRLTSSAYALNAGNGTPKGGIIMWSGAIDAIPAGWALCDGSNGTPNLQERFVIGASSRYTQNIPGGSETKNLSHHHSTGNHTLTIAEMPAHNHNNGGYSYLLQYTGLNTNSDTDSSSNEPDIKHMGAIQSAGGGQPHNHGDTGSGGSATQDIMPPYFALAFIMKL